MKNKKMIIIALAFLVIFVAAASILYMKFRPKFQAGTKKITVTVVDDKGQEREYKHTTEAKNLRQALEEIEGLSVTGPQDQYGMYVKEVNGVYADYNETGAYWAFYVNGEYCNFSIEEQPVYDGDAFAIKYELGM